MYANNAPVVMIGYSRCGTLQKCLFNLSQCAGVRDRDLYLYLDAPYRKEDAPACKKMQEVAEHMRNEVLPNLRVIKREKNYGVPGNLIDCVTEIVNQYGRIIFFEDDVLVSRTFLKYMDGALESYKGNNRIWGVNGWNSPYMRLPRSYAKDIFLNPRHNPWGFGTWADRWNAVDFELTDWPSCRDDVFVRALIDLQGVDMWSMINGQWEGRLHTWDVQCSFYMAVNHLFSISPKLSLTKNIGFSVNGGVHCKGRNLGLERQKYYNLMPTSFDVDVPVDPQVAKLYRGQWIDYSICKRVVRKLMRMKALFGGDNDVPIDA